MVILILLQVYTNRKQRNATDNRRTQDIDDKRLADCESGQPACAVASPFHRLRVWRVQPSHAYPHYLGRLKYALAHSSQGVSWFLSNSSAKRRSMTPSE